MSPATYPLVRMAVQKALKQSYSIQAKRSLRAYVEIIALRS